MAAAPSSFFATVELNPAMAKLLAYADVVVSRGPNPETLISIYSGFRVQGFGFRVQGFGFRV